MPRRISSRDRPHNDHDNIEDILDNRVAVQAGTLTNGERYYIKTSGTDFDDGVSLLFIGNFIGAAGGKVNFRDVTRVVPRPSGFFDTKEFSISDVDIYPNPPHPIMGGRKRRRTKRRKNRRKSRSMK